MAATVDVSCEACNSRTRHKIDDKAYIKDVPATAMVRAEHDHETSEHPGNLAYRAATGNDRGLGITSKLVEFSHGKDHN